MQWKPDIILKIILIMCAIDMTMIWLPLVRGLMDGKTYEWGVIFLSGQGVKGDYWILVLIAVFGFFVQYTGWRGARNPFHWLILIWNVPVFMFTISILKNPETFTFQGDTLGMSIPLGIPVGLFYGATIILVVYWVIRDWLRRRVKTIPRWTLRNYKLLTLVVAIVPIQFILLRFGEPHGTTDKIGVILTIIQWFLLVASLYPWEKRNHFTIKARSSGVVK